MPDWSYHPLFKPWLSKLSGSQGREFIHRGMNIISSLPGGSQLIEFLGHMNPSLHLRREFLGLSFDSPVGLSGKIDPLLSGTRAFSKLGFGFIEVGPVYLTTKHPPNRATFNKKQDQINYPVPFESIGLDATIDRLSRQPPINKPIFIRVGKTNSFEELSFVLKSVRPYGDAFIIEDMISESEFKYLKQMNEQPLLLFSINQFQLSSQISHIKSLYNNQLVDGIIIEENFITEKTTQFSSATQTKNIVLSLDFLHEHGLSDMTTIISGGIDEPKDALLYFEHGADLVMLSSGYVLSGPGLPKRINEGLLDTYPKQDEYKGWKWYWLFGLFILFGGLLALFFSMTTVVLPYDEAFLQITREELMLINPNLIYFMAHDRMTLAGTMISGGILYMQLARYGVRKGIHWARRAINIAGVLGFLGILMFIGYGYFDWLHGLFWIILIPAFYLGWKQTRNALEVSSSRNRSNHKAWRKGLYGQLCFSILGFSFVLGGLVISTIGVTKVFVSTDIQYICMTIEQMNDITEKLIPVIAHDRAGFGSALISVGLLVLMLSLWGFHQGEKWVWCTFLIGGIPAFSAGIITHFIIGYTTTIHLLPAYFALILYITGLILSKDFFYETRRI